MLKPAVKFNKTGVIEATPLFCYSQQCVSSIVEIPINCSVDPCSPLMKLPLQTKDRGTEVETQQIVFLSTFVFAPSSSPYLKQADSNVIDLCLQSLFTRYRNKVYIYLEFTKLPYNTAELI